MPMDPVTVTIVLGLVTLVIIFLFLVVLMLVQFVIILALVITPILIFLFHILVTTPVTRIAGIEIIVPSIVVVTFLQRLISIFSMSDVSAHCLIYCAAGRLRSGLLQGWLRSDLEMLRS